MPARINIIGERYTSLVVVSDAPSESGFRRSVCVCDCGNFTVVRNGNLSSGNTISCGCLGSRATMSSRTTTHGHSKNHATSKEFRAWCKMRQRCYSPSDKSYKNYGARGITVCAQWLLSFENFFADMGRCPSPQLTLERVDNELGYYKTNCVWGTRTEQSRNRRFNVRVTVRGVEGCVSELCEKFGTDCKRTYRRLKTGWTPEDAFFKPPRSTLQPHRTGPVAGRWRE